MVKHCVQNWVLRTECALGGGSTRRKWRQATKPVRVPPYPLFGLSHLAESVRKCSSGAAPWWPSPPEASRNGSNMAYRKSSVSGDIDQLASGIQKLLDSPELRMENGPASLEKATTDWSAPTHISRLVHVFEAVVGRQ